MLARVSNGQLDKFIRQGFELLAIDDGGSQGGGVLGRDALTDIGFIAPYLMLEVRARLGPGGKLPILGLETSLLHGLEGSHLLEEGGSLSVEFSVHFRNYV